MPEITDLFNSPIGYLPFALQAGEQSAPVSIRIREIVTGSSLFATLDPKATVWGRELGSTGDYFNLHTEPIDLEPYLAQEVADFEIIVEASADVVGLYRGYVYLTIRESGAAGWLT